MNQLLSWTDSYHNCHVDATPAGCELTPTTVTTSSFPPPPKTKHASSFARSLAKHQGFSPASSRGSLKTHSSFDEQLTKHRDSLKFKVDSLKSSLEQFDRKCRSHISLTGLRRRRSDGDLALVGYGQFVAMGSDTTTSESDTDESVIEVCADEKRRQNRATQTTVVGCSCKTFVNHGLSGCKTSQKDAVTQTVSDSDQTSDIEEVTTGEQLLVFKILAKQRSNSGIIQPVNNNIIAQQDAWSSSVINSRGIKSDGSFCNDLRCTQKSKVSRRLQPTCSNGNIDDEGDAVSDGDDLNDGLDCGISLHAEDDLWRLAEEGRLPWVCEVAVSQMKTSDNLHDTQYDKLVVARLFYYNEVYQVSTPVGFFRRFKMPRVHLPPWRLISTPPTLDVIPE